MKFPTAFLTLGLTAVMAACQTTAAQEIDAGKFLNQVGRQTQGHWRHAAQQVVPHVVSHVSHRQVPEKPPFKPPVHPPTCPGGPRPTFPTFPPGITPPTPPISPPPVVTLPIVTPPVVTPPVVTPPTPPVVPPPVVPTLPIVNPPTPDPGKVRQEPLRFVVMEPAKMPHPLGPGAPIPDPNPIYLGQSINEQMFQPDFGTAVVRGGSKVGTKWLGCTYTTPQCSIPGFGYVEPMP